MKELKGACIIGQSGGPTSVINASAYGVIDTALKSGLPVFCPSCPPRTIFLSSVYGLSSKCFDLF